MAFVRVVLPRRLFAAGSPLPRHPPAADFLRFRRIFEVENHHDVADVAVHGRRDVGIAAVEIEAVYAARMGRAGPECGVPFGNQLGLRGLRDVINADAAVVAIRRNLTIQRMHCERFAVDQHEVAVHAHLVRVRSRRHRELGEQFRIFRIFDVDDLRAVRIAHVADVGNVALNHHLAAAGAVGE